MTVRRHALKAFRKMNLPVSYRILDEEALSDAKNVFDNQGVTETRYGIARYNTTSLGGAILSTSFFKTSAGVRYKLAKVGTDLYSVAASGASTVIKSGLSATTKHTAVTLNDRHIIAIESDGLFSWDGTLFNALGQAAPTTGTATIAAGGSLSNASSYKIGLTFYASGTGFETNVFESNQVTATAGDKQIDITNIPATATNTTIDEVRIYLKNVTTNSEYLFIATISLGTTTYTVSAPSTSTIIPPTTHGVPLSGGGKYLALFGNKLVYAGNATYPNEVFFSEEYLPDAFDGTVATQTILQIAGAGPITGLGSGLYDQSFLSPFLVAFKKTTTSVYSELSNIPVLAVIDQRVGCLAHNTIKIHNGGVYFMSESGWRGIVNGRMLSSNQGRESTLGGGTIDDIFRRVGSTTELNIPQASNFFSAFYSTNSQYMTFVSEGSSTSIQKAYVYEEAVAGFRVYTFKTVMKCACEGEDDDGYQCIFIGDDSGILFEYSSRNSRHDEDFLGNTQSIPASVVLPYIIPGESANSYNFRTLAVRALSSSNLISIQAYPSFSTLTYNSFDFSFLNSSNSFTLDVSQLDVDTLGDEKLVVTAIADLNLTGETMLIGFYQDIVDANIGLVSAQMSLNKNGNANS